MWSAVKHMYKLFPYTTLFRSFQRVNLEIGQSTEKQELATDERLELVRKGEEDLDLISTYFDFGRYLLISSSRPNRSEEHTSELQSRGHLVCRLLLGIKS